MDIDLRSNEALQRFRSASGERLLHAGLRAGIGLPYECASGTCGTCKATLVTGDIEDLWPQSPGRKHLRGSKEFLLCQCAARGDCVIEVRPGKSSGVARPPQAGKGLLTRRRDLAPDVLAFAVDLDRPIDFEAGQFVGLQFPAAPGFRSYSMVNYESGARRLEFVVKRKPDGKLTPWLLSEAVDGTPVEWFGPLGAATYRAFRNKNLLCIAGGTGIAGMLSILTCAASSGHFGRGRADVFFGVRSLADAFYLGELNGLASMFPGVLEVTIAVSDEPPASEVLQPHFALRFRHGLVHKVAAEAMRGRYERVEAYLAGPPPAVNATLGVLLLEAKLPAADIRFDKFS